MHKRNILPLAAMVLATGLGGCGDSPALADVPPPAALTRDAIGYYCNMIVDDHRGPKGQIFLRGEPEPLWFSSARDTLAFTMLAEESKRIAAIYVNDMGRASWDRPEPGTWTDARTAWYVLGSGTAGGMGAPEAVPFAERDAAEAFAQSNGGRVLGFADVPRDAVLSAVDTDVSPAHERHADHGERGESSPAAAGVGAAEQREHANASASKGLSGPAHMPEAH